MANDKRVAAVGTEFSVRLDGDRVSVTLVEGVVTVDHADADGKFASGAGKDAQVLQAGEQLIAVEGQPFRKASIDTEIATSWRDGRIVFNNEPLSRVVPELNRYTSRKLVIGSESLANMRVSGSFRAGSSDNFAETLQATFPVRIESQEDRIILNWDEQ
jgi:transmembrane sensor